MELLTVLIFVLLGWLFFKFLAVFFHVGGFLLALPFMIIGGVLSALLVGLVMIPLGIIAALAGILAIPIAIAVNILPYLLVGAGIYYLVKKL